MTVELGFLSLFWWIIWISLSRRASAFGSQMVLFISRLEFKFQIHLVREWEKVQTFCISLCLALSSVSYSLFLYPSLFLSLLSLPFLLSFFLLFLLLFFSLSERGEVHQEEITKRHLVSDSRFFVFSVKITLVHHRFAPILTHCCCKIIQFKTNTLSFSNSALITCHNHKCVALVGKHCFRPPLLDGCSPYFMGGTHRYSISNFVRKFGNLWLRGILRSSTLRRGKVRRVRLLAGHHRELTSSISLRCERS